MQSTVQAESPTIFLEISMFSKKIEVTRSGRPGYPPWQATYHVNVSKLKLEIIWTGGLPHLSGLPHLPGVPHLHINRP